MNNESIFKMKPLAIVITVIHHVAMITRSIYYSFIFSRIGKKCRFGRNISFVSPQNITLGNNVRIGDNVALFGRSGLSIGSDVYIANNSSIITADHDYSCSEKSIIAAGRTGSPVTIGSNVWIGMNVVVLKGVNIPNGTIVGAGSVVTRNFPPDKIIAGVPARIIKDRYKAT